MWIEGPAVDELAEGEAVLLAGVSPPIAVFNVDGEFLAAEDTCPHAVSSLSQDGYITGGVVECGYHFAKFDIRTGRLLSPPSPRGLKTYPTKVADGHVHVDVPEDEASQ